MDTASLDPIFEAIRPNLGDYSGPDVQYSVIYRRPWSLIYMLQSERTRPVVLKWRPRNGYSEADVAAMYEHWRELGVPTPEVYLVGSACGGEFIVLEYVHGSNGKLHGFSSEGRRRLMAQIGRMLAVMRSIPAPRHGFLGQEEPHGTEGLLSSLVNEEFHSSFKVLQNRNIIDESERQILEELAERTLSRGQAVAPTLLHGDLGVQNTISDSETGQLRAILDPVPLGGDPLYDLAVLKHFHTRERLAALALDASVAEIEEAYSSGWQAVLEGYQTGISRPLATSELVQIDDWETLILARKTVFFLWHDRDRECQPVSKSLRGRLVQDTSLHGQVDG